MMKAFNIVLNADVSGDPEERANPVSYLTPEFITPLRQYW
jgi:hypothetical protein